MLVLPHGTTLLSQRECDGDDDANNKSKRFDNECDDATKQFAV